MGTASYDWLITTRSDEDSRYINLILNETSIRFDQNIVVAYPSHKYRPEQLLQGLCDNNFNYKSNSRSQNRLKSLDILCNDVKYDRKTCFRHYIHENFGRNELRDGYYRSTDRFKKLARNHTYTKYGKVWPLFNTGVTNFNYSRTFQMTNASRFSLARNFRGWSQNSRAEENSKAMKVHLVQYFKVRINSTLYAHYLGEYLPSIYICTCYQAL